MNIGIDKIGFYTPRIYVDMVKLAEARGIDPDKYTIGLGQEQMAVAPLSQDAVTMAANAALGILDDEDRQQIDMVLVGTESGVDHSKSVAVWVHQLTGIQPYARAVELKQACYSATASLQLALGHIALHPESKVLVVGTDIAKYGLETGGEPTQGAGAVAMVISANPRILTLAADAVSLTQDIADFWRPLYAKYAKVDGKFSNQAYLSTLTDVWETYKDVHGLQLSDFETLLFHTPYTKMGSKAIKQLAQTEPAEDIERLQRYYEASRLYNKRIGNIYTGSLYLSLLSLLEQGDELPAGARLGLFSYGSGAVGEFFTGTVQAGYREHLHRAEHEALLETRRALSIAEYEALLASDLDESGEVELSEFIAQSGEVVLSGVSNHIRQYTQVK
ncbi:hydroxymethylglutaryl-CoA synthase [Dolosigranulum pigrum]|uniref:hydroxymethylglutaryl-CoA synthase n=1 Tax=Dolosigranulum pigrum TaxID=29394 RepID=UPI00370DCE5F